MDLANYSIFVDQDKELISLISTYGGVAGYLNDDDVSVVVGLVKYVASGSHSKDIECESELRWKIDFHEYRARDAIVRHCLKNLDLSPLEEVVEKISVSDVVDYSHYDVRILALALMSTFFELEARLYAPSREWVRIAGALGWISQPTYWEVRQMPEIWFCVVLAVYGMACEIVRLLVSKDSRRDMLDVVIGSVVSEGTVVRLTRGMVRDLIFASVPIFIMSGDVTAMRDKNLAILARIVCFDGLEEIIKEEGLLHFNEIVGKM
ncbi:hypothetical protein [Burkholderia sp. Ax-1719]|uniref:hypothetical protein n=1 Tax=Burkholderia sp. Ax-1719 TaxID=2608334 RepID=UPI001F047F03|nr:hypothetical protein [Burkholderia sp. Ax-1719]